MDAVTVQPIDALTLQERVYLELKRLIISGHFAPGQVLTIRSLATSLGTSVMPVREALQRLSADQAISVLPNRSIRVPFLKRTHVAELFEIRRQLEGLAGARAVAHLSATDIEALEDIQERSRAAAKSGDADTVVETYRQFCFKIFESSDSIFLLNMIEGLWLKMGPTRRTAILELLARGAPKRDERFPRINLVTAMRSKNPVEASKAMKQVVDVGEQVILQYGRLQESD